MIPYVIHESFQLITLPVGYWFLFHYPIGWTFGVFYAIKEFIRRKDLSLDLFLRMLIIGFIGSIVGARVFAYYGPWGYSRAFLETFFKMISPENAGWVAYGGVIGGLGAGYLYARLKKVDVKKYFNVFIPSVPLGVGLARIGCFISGSCAGSITKSNLPWILKLKDYAIHPTQLYNSLTNFTIFIILLILYDKNLKEGKERNLFFYYILLYSVFRFITEFFRGDYRLDNYIVGLTTSQIISIVGFVFAIGYFILKKPEKRVKIRAKPLNIPLRTYSIIVFGMILSVVSVLFSSTSYWLMSILFTVIGLFILLYGIIKITSPLRKPNA